MKIYLASPFFNEDQSRVVGMIEHTLRYYSKGHTVFSPREGTKLGDALGVTFAERKAAAGVIFKRNIDAMEAAEVMVAVVDGSDAGTLFEVGWFNAKGKPIVSYTEHPRKGLNIMLQEAVVAHCRGIAELRDLFGDFSKAESYRKFSSEMI